MTTATAHAQKDQAQAELERRMLRQMLLIRHFEEKAAEAYALGKIGGFCHLYIGQEAVAVGSLAALRDDDYVISSYREHGQALARGVPANAIMAELFGKATGCSKGKGGSMHLFDVGRRFMGGRAGERNGRAGGVRRDPARRGARAQGRPPDPARGSDLPFHGPLDVRPAAWRVPHQGRSRRAAQARSDLAARREAQGGGRPG